MLLDRLLPSFSPHIPPEARITENSQATVYWHTAIPLINRYCQKLPSDLFTRLVAECTEIECEAPQKGMFVARIQVSDCRAKVSSLRTFTTAANQLAAKEGDLERAI